MMYLMVYTGKKMSKIGSALQKLSAKQCLVETSETHFLAGNFEIKFRVSGGNITFQNARRSICDEEVPLQLPVRVMVFE